MNCATVRFNLSRSLREILDSAISTCLPWERRFPVVPLTRYYVRITMSDTTDSLPKKPSVTAIALSRKNLPSFSQARCETDSESKSSPNSGAETFLRSVLGIGIEVAGSHADRGPVTDHTDSLPVVDDLSAEDPAIVGWGLHTEAPAPAIQTEDCNSCSESGTEGSTNAGASARKSRRKRRRRSAALSETDEVHSPVTISKETAVEDVDSGLLAELPAGAVSSSSEDESDVVYSLKPLFAGVFDRPGKGKKAIKGRSDSSQKRPNYFVALQVDNVEVHKAARRVQEHLCSVKPEIVPFLVPIATLHITVLVLRIEEDDALQRAKDALRKSQARLKDEFERAPLVLEFKGLASFGGKVLYIKTAEGEACSRLQGLADVCLEEFAGAELDLSGHKEFRPHLTLAKLSRATQREKVVKKIEKEWYGDFAEESFGEQRVNHVQLLSMNKPKDERGYYYNSLQLDLGPMEDIGPQEADHTECCHPFVSPLKTVSSSGQKKRKLLQELESAKEKVKRKVSTLTEATLKKTASAESPFGDEPQEGRKQSGSWEAEIK